MVRGNSKRSTVTRNLVRHKSHYYEFSRNRFERYGFHPTGETINSFKNVLMSIRRMKRTDHVFSKRSPGERNVPKGALCLCTLKRYQERHTNASVLILGYTKQTLTNFFEDMLKRVWRSRKTDLWKTVRTKTRGESVDKSYWSCFSSPLMKVHLGCRQIPWRIKGSSETCKIDISS